MPSSPAKNGGLVLLEFKCPQARMPVHVEVPGHTEAVKSNWTREIRVRCPHCRAVHWFSYRTGYIEAAISQLNKAPVTHRRHQPVCPGRNVFSVRWDHSVCSLSRS